MCDIHFVQNTEEGGKKKGRVSTPLSKGRGTPTTPHSQGTPSTPLSQGTPTPCSKGRRNSVKDQDGESAASSDYTGQY